MLLLDSFFKKVSILSVSTGLKFIVQFIILIFASNILPLEAYGLYQSMFLFINFFSIVAVFGLNNLLLIYPLQQVVNYVKLNIKTIFPLFLIFSFLLLFVLFFTYNHFQLFQKWLLLVLLITQVFSIVQDTLLLKAEKYNSIFLSSIVYILLFAATHFLFFKYSYGLSFILWGTLVTNCVKILSQINIFFSSISFTGISFLTIDWFYIWLNDLFGNIAKWLDKWVVLFLLPQSYFAIYFNGTYEIPIFLLLLSAVNNIAVVQFANNAILHNRHVKVVFYKSTLILSVFILPAFCYLYFFTEEIFQFFFKQKYQESIKIFKIAILILPVRIVCSTALLQARKKNNVILMGSIFDVLVTIALMYFLYPIFNIQGLVVAYILATYLQVGFYLWQTSLLIKKPILYFFPAIKVIVIFTISLTATFLLKLFLNNFVVKYQFFYGFALTIILCSIFLYFFNFLQKSKSGIVKKHK